jgi:prevent-host-death family protein
MKLVTVAEVKNKLSEYLKRAEKEDIVITRSAILNREKAR